MLDDTDYELYRAGNGDPYEDYYGITHVNWNSELIWTDRYNSGYSWGVNTAPTGLPGTAYGGVGPTQQQVDAYAMNNGRYPIIGYEASGDPIIDNASGYSKEEELQNQTGNIQQKDGATLRTTISLLLTCIKIVNLVFISLFSLEVTIGCMVLAAQ